MLHGCPLIRKRFTTRPTYTGYIYRHIRLWAASDRDVFLSSLFSMYILEEYRKSKEKGKHNLFELKQHCVCAHSWRQNVANVCQPCRGCMVYPKRKTLIKRERKKKSRCGCWCVWHFKMSDDVLSDGEIPRSYNTWHRMHAQQQTDCNWASMYTGMELDQNQARHNGDITFVHFSTSDADNRLVFVYLYCVRPFPCQWFV